MNLYEHTIVARQDTSPAQIKLLSEKYTFNATKNPKDKGPFPQYTLWYYNDELLKMEFKNPNDKKHTITIVRNDWE